MSDRALQIALIGHTNAGKTSLLRTLLRDADFGEVSDRPGTTQDVTECTIRVDGVHSVVLVDTPGLEDSIGLLEEIESHRIERASDPIDSINFFLSSEAAQRRFVQEAKAVRGILHCDLVLYVVDAREPVLAKYRDELRILSYSAKPVVPVLNFVASAASRSQEWRQQLARLALHATAEFDTVVLDPDGELRLWEKVRTLTDDAREVVDALIHQRKRERASLVRTSARAIAEMLTDVASLSVIVSIQQQQPDDASVESMRDVVRNRERECIHSLLQIHRFRETDLVARPMPIENGAWQQDLFDPHAWSEYGLKGGGGAAAGAMLGLTIDLMVGGISLGAATLIGAAVGAVLGAGQRPGKQLLHKWTGRATLRVDRVTLQLLAARQIELVRQLLKRGHAAIESLELEAASAPATDQSAQEPAATLERLFKSAQRHPEWSRLDSKRTWNDPLARSRFVAGLAAQFEKLILRSQESPS